MTNPTLDSLSQHFRRDYLRYDALTAQLKAWSEAFPQFVRLRSIGKSLEGRDLWMLIIGKDPDHTRPAVWVDGNMHATELSGSSVALSIAEDVIKMHLTGEPPRGLPLHVAETLKEVLFYVTPRLCPDGAEAVLRTGQYVRSNPRDRRVDRATPRWRCQDIDGDGVCLLMRKPDPSGEFVEAKGLPGLMLPRQLEDEGPFYKLFPEGIIEPFDGVNIPDPHFLSDNDTDLNRNFPWSWMPEPEQVGAGAFPTSEPESRAVVEFFTEHPEIFAWLNLHTFGGVYIRPLGHAPDKKMDPFDLAVFRQIEQWGEDYGGYPTVSGYEEFLYEPDKPLHGDMVDFGYHQRGCIAYVCELWDLFHQLGIPRRKPFVEHYTHLSREEMLRLGRWDQEHNHGRVLRPWRRCVHPQLGEVEVGGVDPRVGLSNPPYELLNDICERQSAAFLRVAALAPRLRHQVKKQDLADGATQVTLRLENDGYLPTYILGSARNLPWNEPLTVAITASGCSLADATHRRELGHLEGWGRGRYGGPSALFYQRSRGTVSSRELSWVVLGHGSLTLRFGACRMGFQEVTVEV